MNLSPDAKRILEIAKQGDIQLTEGAISAFVVAHGFAVMIELMTHTLDTIANETNSRRSS